MDSSKVGVMEILDDYAEPNGGVIDFEDFLNIYSLSISRSASKETLLKMFAVMDVAHEDVLTPSVLTELARKVKLPLTEQQAQLIV
jgi:Ca2+-binding EF-hand superfamily protein